MRETEGEGWEREMQRITRKRLVGKIKRGKGEAETEDRDGDRERQRQRETERQSNSYLPVLGFVARIRSKEALA